MQFLSKTGGNGISAVTLRASAQRLKAHTLFCTVRSSIKDSTHMLQSNQLEITILNHSPKSI